MLLQGLFQTRCLSKTSMSEVIGPAKLDVGCKDRPHVTTTSAIRLLHWLLRCLLDLLLSVCIVLAQSQTPTLQSVNFEAFALKSLIHANSHNSCRLRVGAGGRPYSKSVAADPNPESHKPCAKPQPFTLETPPVRQYKSRPTHPRPVEPEPPTNTSP